MLLLSSVTHVPPGLMGCACICCPQMVFRGKMENSNMKELFCSTLYCDGAMGCNKYNFFAVLKSERMKG